jgi:hypothetical protein
MDAPSIDHLPPELLITIATFITDQSAIFRLAAVCRCWYDVLTGTSTLWTSIDCRRGYRTAILLHRSKPSLINVTVDRSFSPQAVFLVINHTYRMRSINVDLPSGQLREVRSLLDGWAPLLETMSLGPAPSFPPYSSLFQGNFPALRTLRLVGYPSDLARPTPTITNGLTTLVLGNTQYHHLHDLLKYLGHCKGLVHLRIDLPNLQETVSTPRVVTFPNLKELQIVYPPLTLHHLSFPPSVDLYIEPRTRAYTGGYYLAGLWSEDKPPKVLESYVIKSVAIMFIGFDCLVRLSGPRLFLAEGMMAPTKHRTRFPSCCLDFLRSLPITTAECLRFVQLPEPPFRGTFRPESCTRLLQQMPALRQIDLDVSIAPFFIHALEPVDGRVPCPKLQVLTIIRRGDLRRDLRNSLFTLSNQRQGHGCPLVYATRLPNLSDWRDTVYMKRTV